MKRARPDDTSISNDGTELIKINAGGKIYYTKLRTLTDTFPESMIATLFKHRDQIPHDDQCVYFLDVDPTLFGALLNVLRRPSLANTVPQGISRDAWIQELDYWQIQTELDMEEDVLTVVTVVEQPVTLTNRAKLFKEHCVNMEAKLKRCDLIIVDKIIEWYGIDTIIGKAGVCCAGSSFMPDSIAYIDIETEVVYMGIPPSKDARYADVNSYISKDKDKFKKLLIDIMGFQEVTVELRQMKEDFSAFGKAYTKSKYHMLHISFVYSYYPK